MKKIGVFLFCLLLVGLAQAQTFNWVKGGGSPASFTDPTQMVRFMCTDPVGNVYAMSYVGNGGTITADTFHSSGIPGASSNGSILITSYNCSGQMRWAKLIGSADGCDPFGIAADSIGNVYVAGRYSHIGDPLYIGSDTTIPGGSYFGTAIIKLDTSGHFHWIKFPGANTIGSFGAFTGESDPLIVDKYNNAHLFCYIKSGVPLIPGDTSKYGIYDMTYNTAGTLLSAVRLDLDSEWYLNGAVIDPATGKLYVSGQINQSFGYGSLGVDTFYAAAFDVSRNKIWMYFPVNVDATAISGITMDESKHLHFDIWGQGEFSFNGDSVSNTHFAGEPLSGFMTTDTNAMPSKIQKFDGNTAYNVIYQITQLPNNKVAGAGMFAGELRDDYGHSLTTPSGTEDPYLVIIDSASDLESIQKIYGDNSWNGGTAITNDNIGNVYIGGYVTDSIWAVNGTSTISAYHSVGGNTSFFIMKYGVDCGCTAMPVAHYNHSTPVSGSVTFTYTGTTTGMDSIVWNFGDGTRGMGTTPVHTYTASGTYHACVTIYTNCGYDLFCNDITVCFPPVGSFTALPPHGGIDTLDVTYTGTIYSLDSIVWNFGDGHRATGLTAHHTYTATGFFNVCEVTYTGCGNDTVCKYDTVVCLTPPTVAFTSIGIGTINLTYSGTTVGLDSVKWTFGDTHTATGLTATHTYTATGTYHLCVIAFSACGNDTVCIYDSVLCLTPPVATFTVTHTSVITTKFFSYTGSLTGVDSVTWSFGDGSTATSDTITHAYADTGYYHICVYAHNACGVDSICENLHVDSSLGVENIGTVTANLEVYPNPVEGSLIIQQSGNTTHNNLQIKVHDVIGQLVYIGNMIGKISAIDVSSWTSGVYILDIRDDNGIRKMYRVVKE